MPESNPRPKPSLTRAKAGLREQWTEVIQVLGDHSKHSKTPANPNPAPGHALKEVATNA
jgi:hypothetical protein